MIQPKIPLTANELIAAVFYSEQMVVPLAEITNVQFDRTFFTVPKRSFQLWTIFVSVGRHSLPAIHCLMSSKSQNAYEAVWGKIANNVSCFDG